MTVLQAVRAGVRRAVSLAVSLSVLAAASGSGAGAAPDVAIWVYGWHRWSPAEREHELARLATMARRLYLSVEDRARLLVDAPEDAAHLGEFLDRATGAYGLAVEAMLLQDPAWAADAEGAAARVGRVAAFHAARQASGRPGFTGLHFDIEPHSEPSWPCADTTERAALLHGLHAVFARVGQAARAASPAAPLRLSAALPWWLGPLSAEIAEAAPAAWLRSLDEVVLMVYGDPGGPLVGETAAAVLRRVADARLWRDLPPDRGIRVGLATYEYRDATTLRTAVDQLAEELTARSGFRGLAVFASDQTFDAPLVPLVEGRVVDAAGQGVPNARVRADRHVVRTSPCGLFGIKGSMPAGVELEVDAPGFAPARLGLGTLAPGRVRELPPIRLAPAP